MKATTSSRDARAEAPAAPMNWLDVYAGLLEHWIDWQSEAWQPIADAQAEYLRLCQDRLGWPGGEVVSLRGAEQLG
jgi:hypothetical protein